MNLSMNLSKVQYTMIDPVDSKMMTKELQSKGIAIKLVAVERAKENHITFYYSISIPGEPTFKIRPGALTTTLVKRTGIVACDRLRYKQDLAFSCALVHQGWVLTIEQIADISASSGIGIACCVWPKMSDIMRCVAMARAKKPFLRQDECISCCTFSIMREHAKEHLTNSYCPI